MTTITLFLILLLYSHVTVGFTGSNDATVKEEKNPFTPKAYVKRYWDKKITNNLPKPSFLLSKASPLSAVETATFTKLATTHALSTRLHEFCSSAKLLCSIESKPPNPKNGNKNFAEYQNHKNFTNYGPSQLGGGDSFKNYSQNEDLFLSQNDFRRYSRESTDRKDHFQNYASGSNSVSQNFNTYGAGAGDFKQYTDGTNDPHLRFTAYSGGAAGRIQNFTSYSDRTNSGDQVFSNYGKKGKKDENVFTSYTTKSNTADSNFTSYGENGNGVSDEFKNYAVNMNDPNNNFRNYGDGGNRGVDRFVNYRVGSNSGIDGFTSYAKKSVAGKVDFVNYGRDDTFGTDTFIGYAKGAEDPIIGFKGYENTSDIFVFKEYAKSGVSFKEYINERFKKKTMGSVSMADKVASGKFVNKWVEPGKFFRESTLKEGTVMPMPDIRDKMPERSFLPRSILSKLPFSSSTISELKEIFKVPNDSSMEKILVSSLGECERAPSQGETKRCVGSIEDMIDFSTSVLGRDVTVRTTGNVNGSNQHVTVGSIKRINGGRVTQSVSCHQSLFPYLLYYCHSVPKVRVYEVDLLDPNTKAKINHGVAICHLDTSAWGPTHGAFLALGPGPGRIEVCHWIFQNDMTWVVAD